MDEYNFFVFVHDKVRDAYKFTCLAHSFCLISVVIFYFCPSHETKLNEQ